MWAKSVFKNKRRGQMLVEALMALSVLTVGFLGILTLLSRSTALTRVVSDNYIATYLASEGIEIIKNLVDANIIQEKSWDDGFRSPPQGRYEVDYLDDDPNQLERFTGQGRFLNFDTVTHTYSYGSGSPSIFKRIVAVSVDLPNRDEITVVSSVSWTGRGGSPSQVLAEDHFYNWRP